MKEIAKKILFVSLPSQPEHIAWKRFNITSTALRATRPPMGLGYLAQAVEDAGIDYDVIDMRLGYSYPDLKRKIEETIPTHIGFSMMTPMYLINYELISHVRRDFPNLTLILGGPHVTTFKEEVFEKCPIDIAVLSEAEHTIIKYLQGVPLKSLDGVIYRENDGIEVIDKSSYVDDINEFNWPRYNKFELDKYLYRQMPVFTSRGCPYKCIFCSVENNLRRFFRGRDAKSVVDEIEYWVKYGYKDFEIEDDNFTFRKERVFDICDEIEKRGLAKKAFFHLDQGVRADKVNLEVFKRLREVGFITVSIAVEAGNNKTLRALKKGEKIETIERAIQDACDTGFEVRLLFVIGAPGEIWEDVQDSLRVASKYPVMSAKFCNLVPFPGTELMDYVIENKLLKKQPEDYLNEFDTSLAEPLFDSPTLSLEERKLAFNEAERINRKLFVNYIVNKSFSSSFLKTLIKPSLTMVVNSRILSSMLNRKFTRDIIFSIRNRLASRER
jgi:radical SAM superfamily enzyme YgiQ (UPF0313 family)